MPITIKIWPKKNPISQTIKWHPVPETQHPIDRAEFLDRLEKRSTLASADVKGALDALEYELKQVLLSGNSVRLGDLGSFHVTLKTEGSETKAECSADNIKRVRVQFRPSASLMRDMQPAPTGKARFTQKTTTI